MAATMVYGDDDYSIDHRQNGMKEQQVGTRQ